MPKNFFTFLPLVAYPADRRKIYSQNRCSYVRQIYRKKIGPPSQSQPEKITFPPEPDGRTDGRTDSRTDICFYRVPFLLKRGRRNLKIYQCSANMV